MCQCVELCVSVSGCNSSTCTDTHTNIGTHTHAYVVCMHVVHIVASTFEIVDKIHEFTMRSKKLLKIITKCITSLQAVETLEKHVQSIGRESQV